jgi:hypothetical protein
MSIVDALLLIRNSLLSRMTDREQSCWYPGAVIKEMREPVVKIDEHGCRDGFPTGKVRWVMISDKNVQECDARIAK